MNMHAFGLILVLIGALFSSLTNRGDLRDWSCWIGLAAYLAGVIGGFIGGVVTGMEVTQ